MERLRERTWLAVTVLCVPILIYSIYNEGLTKNTLLYSLVFALSLGMYILRRKKQ